MLKPEKLPDLANRSASALAMIFLGFWGIWIGGFVFQILVSIVCGVMIWDGLPTKDEDANGDGNPANDFSDPNNPTLADYLNPDIN